MTRALPAPRLRRPGPLPVLACAALLAAASVALGCNPAPSGAPSSGATAGPSAGPTTTVRAYFFLGTFTDSGGLAPVERAVPQLEPAGATERGALEALLAGPNEAELGASPAMYTLMPEGTRLLGLDLGEGGVATVDLSGEFESGGSASAKGRLAQVVFTLTQFPSITAVRFKLDGRPIMAFSDAALPLEPPVDRSAYTDQLPLVFVDQPAWGGVLGNPAHIAGLANVFEAQFLVRILDAGGSSLAEGPVMATCGTGCWGTFDETFPYAVQATAPGRLQAYELSEVDGSIVNLTEYPVTLSP